MALCREANGVLNWRRMGGFIARLWMSPRLIPSPSRDTCVPAHPNVRGVLAGKLPPGKTFAANLVNVDASKYLGVSAPRSSGGHPAGSST